MPYWRIFLPMRADIMPKLADLYRSYTHTGGMYLEKKIQCITINE